MLGDVPFDKPGTHAEVRAMLQDAPDPIKRPASFYVWLVQVCDVYNDLPQGAYAYASWLQFAPAACRYGLFVIPVHPDTLPSCLGNARQPYACLFSLLSPIFTACSAIPQDLIPSLNLQTSHFLHDFYFTAAYFTYPEPYYPALVEACLDLPSTLHLTGFYYVGQQGLAVEVLLAADQQPLLHSDTVSFPYIPDTVKAPTRPQDLGPMVLRLWELPWEFRSLHPSDPDSMQIAEVLPEELCIRCRPFSVPTVFVLWTPLPTSTYDSCLRFSLHRYGRDIPIMWA
ncbi:hypothetical protein chiPu_0009803 [Chiloscyllium punctatum]|uniref:Uncharacterized protein n=1 Tax=Chiloscyllium punctatum TaxID=137246 RepID=A0A401SLU1_CHIPU|nr:hypothetical protein [Chiloscyllium punctatum]